LSENQDSAKTSFPLQLLGQKIPSILNKIQICSQLSHSSSDTELEYSEDNIDNSDDEDYDLDNDIVNECKDIRDEYKADAKKQKRNTCTSSMDKMSQGQHEVSFTPGSININNDVIFGLVNNPEVDNHNYLQQTNLDTKLPSFHNIKLFEMDNYVTDSIIDGIAIKVKNDQNIEKEIISNIKPISKHESTINQNIISNNINKIIIDL